MQFYWHFFCVCNFTSTSEHNNFNTIFCMYLDFYVEHYRVTCPKSVEILIISIHIINNDWHHFLESLVYVTIQLFLWKIHSSLHMYLVFMVIYLRYPRNMINISKKISFRIKKPWNFSHREHAAWICQKYQYLGGIRLFWYYENGVWKLWKWIKVVNFGIQTNKWKSGAISVLLKKLYKQPFCWDKDEQLICWKLQSCWKQTLATQIIYLIFTIVGIVEDGQGCNKSIRAKMINLPLSKLMKDCFEVVIAAIVVPPRMPPWASVIKTITLPRLTTPTCNCLGVTEAFLPWIHLKNPKKILKCIEDVSGCKQNLIQDQLGVWNSDYWQELLSL